MLCETVSFKIKIYKKKEKKKTVTNDYKNKVYVTEYLSEADIVKKILSKCEKFRS